MTESEMGNPLALLSYVSVLPSVLVTSTVNDEIDIATGIFLLKE
jgi:hypothetical protein